MGRKAVGPVFSVMYKHPVHLIEKRRGFDMNFRISELSDENISLEDCYLESVSFQI